MLITQMCEKGVLQPTPTQNVQMMSLERPIYRISPIGASNAQWTRANAKKAIFMGKLQELSSG